MTNEQNHIIGLNMKRDEFLHIYELSYDEDKEDYNIKEPPQIDELSKDILNCLINWEHKLSFEFIFEQLTRLGFSPNLIYDDNGNFGISDEGINSINLNDSKEYNAFEIVYKDKWYTSIREALKHFLNEIK